MGQVETDSREEPLVIVELLPQPIDLRAAMRKEFELREKATLNQLKQSIEKLIDVNPVLKQFKNQLLIDVTAEGLRIQIDQARTLLEDMPVDVFKIGLLGSVDNIAAIAGIVADYPDIPLVFDPVLASGRGDELADEEMIDPAQRQKLGQRSPSQLGEARSDEYHGYQSAEIFHRNRRRAKHQPGSGETAHYAAAAHTPYPVT